ncbi:hypothetical protein BH10BAC1_BH10BAC1_01910 [soil metagenome]
MKTYKIVILLTAIFIISGCSIEKRHYNNGYRITWNLSKTTAIERTHDTTYSELLVETAETKISEPENYPLTSSSDSVVYIINKKKAIFYTPVFVANDTLKAKIKKEKKQKKEKIIDPKKQSEKSIKLGIFAICLLVFGVALLLVVSNFSSFSIILFLLGAWSIAGSYIFSAIGLIKALKLLNYLKSNPEENKKNKRKAMIGLILNALILLPLLLFLLYYILASQSY